MREPESYGKVPLSRVKAAIKQVEGHYADCPERLEDVELTFEYLVGSFFPKIVENINKAMKRNLERFPEDFCFQLTNEEYINLK